MIEGSINFIYVKWVDKHSVVKMNYHWHPGLVDPSQENGKVVQ